MEPVMRALREAWPDNSISLYTAQLVPEEGWLMTFACDRNFVCCFMQQPNAHNKGWRMKWYQVLKYAAK